MDKNEFRKYAIKHHGFSSIYLDNYIGDTTASMTPYILEERKMNVQALDVFSRLMADRIIFMERLSTITLLISLLPNCYFWTVLIHPAMFRST